MFFDEDGKVWVWTDMVVYYFCGRDWSDVFDYVDKKNKKLVQQDVYGGRWAINLAGLGECVKHFGVGQRMLNAIALSSVEFTLKRGCKISDKHTKGVTMKRIRHKAGPDEIDLPLCVGSHHGRYNLNKEVEVNMLRDRLNYLKDEWPSSYITRAQVGDFTGGLYSGSTLRKKDSLGIGPADKCVINGKVHYTVDAFIDWWVAQEKRS